MYTKYCKNDLNPPGRNYTGLDMTNTQKNSFFNSFEKKIIENVNLLVFLRYIYL